MKEKRALDAYKLVRSSAWCEPALAEDIACMLSSEFFTALVYTTMANHSTIKETLHSNACMISYCKLGM